MRTQFTGSQESVVNMDMEVPIIGGGLTGRAAPRTSAPASVSASNSPVPGAGGAPAAAQSSPPRAVRALPSCCFVSFRSSRAFYVFLCRFGGGPIPSPPPPPRSALYRVFFFFYLVSVPLRLHWSAFRSLGRLSLFVFANSQSAVAGADVAVPSARRHWSWPRSLVRNTSVDTRNLPAIDSNQQAPTRERRVDCAD